MRWIRWRKYGVSRVLRSYWTRPTTKSTTARNAQGGTKCEHTIKLLLHFDVKCGSGDIPKRVSSCPSCVQLQSRPSILLHTVALVRAKTVVLGVMYIGKLVADIAVWRSLARIGDSSITLKELTWNDVWRRRRASCDTADGQSQKSDCCHESKC
jgi:hypothetical protein